MIIYLYSFEIHSWIWQTCTEFGFFQTCEDASNCPFSHLHSISQDLDICNVAFGVSSEQVRENIENTLELYGGDNIAVSRIMFLNGDVDPWSAQAIIQSNDKNEQPGICVPESSHHFWTHPIKTEDSLWIQAARALIYTQIGEWLVRES